MKAARFLVDPVLVNSPTPCRHQMTTSGSLVVPVEMLFGAAVPSGVDVGRFWADSVGGRISCAVKNLHPLSGYNGHLKAHRYTTS